MELVLWDLARWLGDEPVNVLVTPHLVMPMPGAVVLGLDLDGDMVVDMVEGEVSEEVLIQDTLFTQPVQECHLLIRIMVLLTPIKEQWIPSKR